MNLKTLSWFAWPLLLILGVGIWWQLSDQPANLAGRRVYLQQCANCHMEEGQGLRKLMPPLAGSDYMDQLTLEELACMIRYGVQDSMQVNGIWYQRLMPENPLITEVEMTSLINYLRGEWGIRNKEQVSFQEVQAALREGCGATTTSPSSP